MAETIIQHKDMEAVPSATAYPKTYHTRPMLSTVPYYIGLALLVLAAILVVSGNGGSVTTFIAPALICTFFGKSYRKPRVVISEKEIRCLPNTLREARVIPVHSLMSVREERGALQFLLKDGTSVRMPRFELSAATRRAIVHDARVLIG